MNTTNGTDWDKCGNAIIIYHQQEEAPRCGLGVSSAGLFGKC